MPKAFANFLLVMGVATFAISISSFLFQTPFPRGRIDDFDLLLVSGVLFSIAMQLDHRARAALAKAGGAE